MSQQCSWPTHSWPLEGRCLYYALLGLTQAPGLAGGPDFVNNVFTILRRHSTKYFAIPRYFILTIVINRPDFAYFWL